MPGPSPPPSLCAAYNLIHLLECSFPKYPHSSSHISINSLNKYYFHNTPSPDHLIYFALSPKSSLLLSFCIYSCIYSHSTYYFLACYIMYLFIIIIFHWHYPSLWIWNGNSTGEKHVWFLLTEILLLSGLSPSTVLIMEQYSINNCHKYKRGQSLKKRIADIKCCLFKHH
jgi:hypothetical protein